ncbi:MAG: hypothetical protein CMJ62_17075 [Planctomycetaceae bacterium]|nr:hypothetical protein [Planctomycetaceae bacterium]
MAPTMKQRSLRSLFQVILLLLFSLANHRICWAGTQNEASAPLRRAKPPNLQKTSPSPVFFGNAFAEALEGERPADLLSSFSGRTGVQTQSPDVTEPAENGYAWSRLISATTLEDEVKRIKFAVDSSITTPGRYKSGGFKEGRQYFSMLAFLFAIIAEYDDEVRWKNQAAAARDNFARAGFNSKVDTIQSYNEAKLRKIDLHELVSGGSFSSQPSKDLQGWEQVCDLPLIMRRLEQAHHKSIAEGTASKNEFKKQSDNLIHEAELVAAIAYVTRQENFEYWDDETYSNYCKALEANALEVIRAVKLDDYQAARKATGEISKICSDCHEGYR